MLLRFMDALPMSLIGIRGRPWSMRQWKPLMHPQERQAHRHQASPLSLTRAWTSSSTMWVSISANQPWSTPRRTTRGSWPQTLSQPTTSARSAIPFYPETPPQPPPHHQHHRSQESKGMSILNPQLLPSPLLLHHSPRASSSTAQSPVAQRQCGLAPSTP